MTPSAKQSEFTVLDWVGVAVVVLATTALWLFTLFVVPSMVRLFQDFNSELPGLTRLVIQRYTGPLLSLPAMLLLVLGSSKLLGTTLKWRRLLCVLAFLWTLLALAVCLLGIYLPIFQASAHLA